MKIFKPISIIFLLCTGCLFKNDNVVIKNFRSTESPCLDAYIVNTIASGCENVQSINRVWGVESKCSESSRWDTPWTIGLFYFTPSMALIQDNTFPVCSDQMLTMSYVDKIQEKKGE